MVFMIITMEQYDDVNDRSNRLPCAVTSKCRWWYYACDAINPNERPPEVELPNNGKTVIVDMIDVKIRPKHCSAVQYYNSIVVKLQNIVAVVFTCL